MIKDLQYEVDKILAKGKDEVNSYQSNQMMQLISAYSAQLVREAEAYGYDKGRKSVSLSYTHNDYDMRMQLQLIEQEKQASHE